MASLMEFVVISYGYLTVLCLFVEGGPSLCAKRGCTDKDNPAWEDNNGKGPCSCEPPCIAADNCCDDYLEACEATSSTTILSVTTEETAKTTTREIATTASAKSTTEEVIATTESAKITTEEGASTSESAKSTTEMDTTKTESAITTAQKIASTTESAKSTTEVETTITESAKTTTEEVIATTESAKSTTQVETTSTESTKGTTEVETTTSESAKTTTSEVISKNTTEGEITTTKSAKTVTEEFVTTECGPFPTWLNILRLDTTDGQTIHYTCIDGFHFSDSSDSKTSTCNLNQVWEPAFEQCEESLDATAEAVFWTPTEAPGAYYIGSTGIILVIGELVFLMLVDLSNYKMSFSFCIRNIRGEQSRKRSGDIEASDVDKSTSTTSLSSSGSDLSVFLASGHQNTRPSLQDVQLELTSMEDIPPPVASENMVSW